MPSPTRGRKRKRAEARIGAERDLPESETIVLSARDSRIFVEALLNPQPANEALQAAAREYRERWRKPRA
ncbi:MAG TPA: DUF1778 domain-containing protein [Thermomicrobiales bacterium]|nr:DUF1778 domain-containing protein [Thermomicrobiales bacterium]